MTGPCNENCISGNGRRKPLGRSPQESRYLKYTNPANSNVAFLPISIMKYEVPMYRSACNCGKFPLLQLRKILLNLAKKLSGFINRWLTELIDICRIVCNTCIPWQAFCKPTVSTQDAHLSMEARERQRKGPQTIGKIRKALDFMRNQQLEVPFIAFYRKEYVQPELNINDLWKVYRYDAKVTTQYYIIFFQQFNF